MKEHITACIIAAFWPYTNSSPKHESWKKIKICLLILHIFIWCSMFMNMHGPYQIH